MKINNYKNTMLIEGKKAKVQPNSIIQFLIFCLVFLCTSIVSSIIPSIFMIKDWLKLGFFDDIANVNMDAINDYTMNLPSNILIITNYCTIFLIIGVIIYCKFIEKRSLTSLGLIKKSFLKNYFKGFLLGIIIFSSSVLIAYISGTVSFSFTSNIAITTILISLFGFIIQGASEEFLLRGYLMVSLSNRAPIIAAILVNSLIFALLHLTNPGGTNLLPLINIALFGIFASLYTLKTDNLWGICALHSSWNFLQGNIFGFKVSGIDTNNSLITATSKASGKLINGGSFGMEGGLAVTIVLAAGICVLFYLLNKKVTLLENQVN